MLIHLGKEYPKQEGGILYHTLKASQAYLVKAFWLLLIVVLMQSVSPNHDVSSLMESSNNLTMETFFLPIVQTTQ